MRTSIALYRALLRGLPPSFRNEYGEQMVEACTEMARSRPGPRGTAALWWLLGEDLVKTIGREWKAELMSMSLVRAVAPRIVGLVAVLGALTWFVVFIGPQWNIISNGYRPNAIMLGAVLLTIGTAGQAALEWRDWSRLRRLGAATLLLSIVLLGLQAPIASGVSFDTAHESPVRGLGVYTLPLGVALLILAWGWTQTRVRAVALIPGAVLMALAITLLFPSRAGWFDLWDFVFRYAYLLVALAIVARNGYRLIGGPILRLERPTTPRVRARRTGALPHS